MMNIIEMFRLWISIPKSIYYNIKVFPFSVWKKFPLLIDWNSHVKIPRGGVHIDGEITSGMIKIGRYKGSLLLSNGRKTFFNIEKGGKIVFAGAASFAKGSMVEIGGAAQVKIGSGMTSNANLIISCVDKIEIGNDCLIGWNCTLMDGDGHPVKHNGFEQKNCRKIEIGNHVWLASNVTVLKGTHISDNSVVGYGTIVSGTYNKTNVAILGNRGIAKVEDIEWQR